MNPGQKQFTSLPFSMRFSFVSSAFFSVTFEMSRLLCLQGNQVHIWEWYMNSTHCPEAQAWRNFKCAEMEYAKTGIGGGLSQQAGKHHTAPHSLTHTRYSRSCRTLSQAHTDTAHCEKENAFLHCEAEVQVK